MRTRAIMLWAAAALAALLLTAAATAACADGGPSGVPEGGDEAAPAMYPVTLIYDDDECRGIELFDQDGEQINDGDLRPYGEKIWVKPVNKTGYVTKINGEEINFYVVKEVNELHVTLEAETFTITFDTLGGSPIDQIRLRYGEEIPAIEDPVMEGKTFKGWDKPIPETMPANDLEFTAEWESDCTVTIDADGGTIDGPDGRWTFSDGVYTTIAKYGEEIALPTFTKERTPQHRYEFVAWNPEVVKIAADQRYTARFYEFVNTYTVSFDSAGGEEVPSETVEYGSKAHCPDVPAKDGSLFGRWTADGTGWNFNDPVESDLALTAVWYGASESGDVAVPSAEGGAAEAHIPADASGFHDVTFGFPGCGASVTAAAQDLAGRFVSVRAATEDGAAFEIDVCVDGERMADGTALRIALPYDEDEAGVPTAYWNDGATLHRMETLSAKGGVLTFITEHNSEYRVLYDHTVSFDSAGGTQSPDPETAYAGSAIMLPSPGEKEGQTFAGWLDGVDSVGKVNDKYTVSKDVTLVASWTAEATVCTVTFDAGEGEPVDPIEAACGTEIELPEAARDGYEFVCWHDGDDSVGGAGDAYTVSEDVTLSAEWEERTGGGPGGSGGSLPYVAAIIVVVMALGAVAYYLFVVRRQ